MQTKDSPITRRQVGGKQPKHHARKDRVTAMMRRAKILQAAIEGKDITKAAIETGLSSKSAGQQASQILNSPLAQRAFKMILAERGVTDEFLAEKIRSLLDAKTTIYAQKDGIFTDSREVEALETQRKTAELVAKLKGHLKEQAQVDVRVGLMALVVQAVREEEGEGDG
jgi:phage terminase small subunit